MLPPKGDDWRGVASIIIGRKAPILFATLLLTITLMVYSFHNTLEVDPRTYHGGSGFNIPQEAASNSPNSQPHLLPGTSDGVLVVTGDLHEHSGSASDVLLVADAHDNHDGSNPTQTSILRIAPTPLGGGVPLRVMCLGASVTRGDVSTGNLGFRSPLRDKLAAMGNAVNFVGSQRLGAFKDNDLEAFKGNRIDQIHEHSTHIVPEVKPNVFLIHVGSNDCLQKHDTENAGKRMGDLVKYLLDQSPRATVILSTLLTNTVPSKEPCILDINIQIRKLASQLQREGRPVVLAEMHCEQGLPDRPVPEDISKDGTHPFDHGYELMSDIFFDAFVQADKRGFFKSPEDNGIPLDGELERADEPLTYEPEPPKNPNPPPPAQ
ncbi:carbohydrate esterase family 3 protein [Poronia punctata]|nr:carbohydrate esterase family 3 protein [Poronia punctata]